MKEQRKFFAGFDVMFLTIFFIIMCLAGITVVIMKWKGSVSFIPLVLCLTGIVLIVFLNTGEKKRAQDEKKIRDLNLIEYADFIKKSNNRSELTDAATTAYVNMRNAAGRQGEIIVLIPDGTQIEIISPDHSRGWFHAGYDGKSGWIYGKYLKNVTDPKNRVTTAQVSGNGTFLYIFPEKTWWGKLLGLFIGISISLYLALMGFCDMLSAKRFGISWAYFMLKNIYFFIESYPHMLGFGTFLAILFTSAVVAFFANALSNISLNIIDQYKMKAVSQ